MSWNDVLLHMDGPVIEILIANFREKSVIARNLERMVRELQEAKEKCDELRASKQVRDGIM